MTLFLKEKLLLGWLGSSPMLANSWSFFTKGVYSNLVLEASFDEKYSGSLSWFFGAKLWPEVELDGWKKSLMFVFFDFFLFVVWIHFLTGLVICKTFSYFTVKLFMKIQKKLTELLWFSCCSSPTQGSQYMSVIPKRSSQFYTFFFEITQNLTWWNNGKKYSKPFIKNIL